MIKIIEQSTKQRQQETIQLFNEIKPYLDEGMIYSRAVKKVKGLPDVYACTNLAWFREVVSYGEKMGYSYKEYSGKQGRKKSRIGGF